MNDDLETAEAKLSEGNSSFHKVSKPKFPGPPAKEADGSGLEPGTLRLMWLYCLALVRERRGRISQSSLGIRT